MRRLSLDPGKKCGWAISDGPRIIASGVQEFNYEDIEVRFDKLCEFLSINVLRNNIQEIDCEALAPMHGQTSHAAMYWMNVFNLAVKRVARLLHVPLNFIAINSWRCSFIGTSKAPKEIPQNKRSKWLKDAVVQKCRDIGLEIKDHNEADAVGVLSHVLCVKYPEIAHENTPLFEGAA